MIRTYVLPFLALIGVALAVVSVRESGKRPPAAQPIAPPPRTAFAAFIAGAGIIEASTENIAVGTPVPGVVTELFVKVGDDVPQDQPLMRIDSRDLEATLALHRARTAQAQAQLDQILALPRAEDIPPAQARVDAARAELGEAQARLDLYESVLDRRAITEDELARRRFAAAASRARLAEHQAALAKLHAGPWKPDVDVARTALAAAQAQVRATEVEIDRCTIRSPVSGRVLQVKIRRGEFAAGQPATPLMLIGDVRTLHVRVDIDENDAWRIRPNAPAHASLRGNAALTTDLRFVRAEPYVIPKQSLTGDTNERVDTRVLQLIYAFPATSLTAYVGQQMDVFIEEAGPSKAPMSLVSDIKAPK